MNSNPALSGTDLSAESNRMPGYLSRLRMTEPHRGRIFVACCVIAIAIKIWLTLAFHMRAADAPADDRLFVVLAEHLIYGNWLGPYDQYTLCKGPFFPVWIAVTFLANIPLQMSYQLLHAAACVLVIVAFRPMMPLRSTCLALFLLLLFDPSTYSVSTLLVDRGAIYMSLTLMVVGCVAAMLLRLDRGPAALWRWSVGLGVVLFAFWTTREEGVWILPFAIIALAYALVVIWRRRKAALGSTVLTLLPAGICVVGVLSICAVNQHYYGVFQLVDFKSKAFERANGALMRVKPERWNQYSNVPKDVRLLVYEISPAFAELEEYFEGTTGQMWGEMAEEYLEGGTPAPDDIRGGFFVWAMRDAVQERGHYQTATDAEAYYTQVADEIAAACDSGRLECGPERASLMPPLRREYLAPALESLRVGLQIAIRIPQVGRHRVPSVGEPERLAIFEDIARTQISLEMPSYVESPRLPNQWRSSSEKVHAMRRIASIYRAVDMPLTVMACVAFGVGILLDIRARVLSPAVVLMMGLFAAFWARLIGLVLISITQFNAVDQRYILPLYPMLLLFWFISFHHVLRRVQPKARFWFRSTNESATVGSGFK